MEAAALLTEVGKRLRTPPACGVADVDLLVADALRPGKLLRPDLVVRSALATTGPRPLHAEIQTRVIEAALSVELLHVATLVHDDIIDAAPLRRGRPSVVAAAGVATAIVVGDLLLARGSSAAAAAGGPASAVWARALACMAAGQLRETALAAAPSMEAYAEYSSLKTAELFRASAELGALVVGATCDVVDAHGRFGLHFGRAFQHVDDLLDTIGDSTTLGKPTGADAANGVPTAVSLLSQRGGVGDLVALVADELDTARAALPDPAADQLGAWGAASLKRALHAGAAPAESTDPVARAFGRLEGCPDLAAFQDGRS